jgi:hypothetical protein
MAAWTLRIHQTHTGTAVNPMDIVVRYDDGTFVVEDSDGDDYLMAWEACGFLEFEYDAVALPPTVDPLFVLPRDTVIPVATIRNNHAAAYVYVTTFMRYGPCDTFDFTTLEYEGDALDVAWAEAIGVDNIEGDPADWDY